MIFDGVASHRVPPDAGENCRRQPPGDQRRFLTDKIPREPGKVVNTRAGVNANLRRKSPLQIFVQRRVVAIGQEVIEESGFIAAQKSEQFAAGDIHFDPVLTELGQQSIKHHPPASPSG